MSKPTTKAILAAALAAALLVPSAAAQGRADGTVAEFVRACTNHERLNNGDNGLSQDNLYDAFMCYGFVRAAWAYVVLQRMERCGRGDPLAQVEPQSVIPVFLDWAARHPEEADSPPSGGFALAMYERWRCP